MRDYSETTLTLERIAGRRFLEDKWRWRVRIPAWMIGDGLKATGANPSGTALTRRGALKAARRAVERQMAEDAGVVEFRRWNEDGF